MWFSTGFSGSILMKATSFAGPRSSCVVGRRVENGSGSKVGSGQDRTVQDSKGQTKRSFIKSGAIILLSFGFNFTVLNYFGQKLYFGCAVTEKWWKVPGGFWEMRERPLGVWLDKMECNFIFQHGRWNEKLELKTSRRVKFFFDSSRPNSTFSNLRPHSVSSIFFCTIWHGQPDSPVKIRQTE